MCRSLILWWYLWWYWCDPQSSKDSDRSCIGVLCASCAQASAEHVFDDVLAHFQIATLADINRLCTSDKMSLIFNSPIVEQMPCRLHGGRCSVPFCDVDNSGVPCVDYSPAGSQLGIFGPTFALLCALIAFHRQRGTPVVFIENVPEFPIQILHHLAGDLYEVYAFYLTPEDIRLPSFLIIIESNGKP